MIEKVRLEGWRSHRESEFRFSEGTNALLGIMGSGKSSVVDAVCFALFGTFPALQSRKLTLDEVVMKRPRDMDRAEVEVEIRDDGSTYTVRRAIEKGRTAEAEIRRDGRLLDSGATAVTEAVERLLKTDYHLFSRAVYSEQDGLDYFLQIPAGRRKEKIDELLRIDRFESARSTSTTVINRLRDNIRDRREMIEEMEESGELERLDEVREEMEGIEEELGEKEDERDDLSGKVDQLEERLEELKKREAEIRKLKVEKGSKEGTLESLREKIPEEVPSADEMESELGDRREERDELEEELEERRERKRELEKRKQRIEVSMEEIEDKIRDLQEIGAECPLCGQTITEEHRETHLEEKEEELNGLEEELKDVGDSLDEIGDEVENKEKRLEELKGEIDELEDELEELNEIEERREEMNELQEEIDELEERLQEKREGLEGEEAGELEDELREKTSRLSSLKTEIDSLEEKMADRRDELERLEERKKLYEKHKDRIERMEDVAEEMTKFRGALEDTQIDLRNRFIENVNGAMSRLWDTLYPYEDYVDVRLSVDDDYTLELQENGGGWVPVEGVASGGERTTSLLALRIAFALVLAPQLKWLFLDEPTHNLDTNGVRQLAEVLRDRIGQYVDQVFLITHDEMLEDAVTGYLYRLERDHSKNEATEVRCVLDPTEAPTPQAT